MYMRKKRRHARRAERQVACVLACAMNEINQRGVCVCVCVRVRVCARAHARESHSENQKNFSNQIVGQNKYFNIGQIAVRIFKENILYIH